MKFHLYGLVKVLPWLGHHEVDWGGCEMWHHLCEWPHCWQVTPGPPGYSGRSRWCHHWCCQLLRWTCWQGIHTCSCSNVSPYPNGERKPRNKWLSVFCLFNIKKFQISTLPQDGHLCVPLWMCLWCWRLPGCLNNFPHSSQEYRPPPPELPPLPPSALLTQSK